MTLPTIWNSQGTRADPPPDGDVDPMPLQVTAGDSSPIRDIVPIP
jgi:hypothetical protein